MSDVDYRATSRELFQDQEPQSGHRPEELALAERRLGFALPSALVGHYLAFGKRGYNRAHDRLLAPDAIHVKGDMLVFYEENQQAFVWGTPIGSVGDGDPPVFQSIDDSAEDWIDDHARVSQFFYTMLFHHRARSWPSALGEAPRDGLALIQANRLALPGCRRDLATYYRRGNTVIEVDDFNDGELVRVLAGAPLEADLRSLQAMLTTMTWL